MQNNQNEIKKIITVHSLHRNNEYQSKQIKCQSEKVVLRIS